MPPPDGALPLRHALALGLLQGPTELLPVSSSAHTTLVPWLAGWPYGGLEPEVRKTFELALHAGAGAALALAMRRELAATARTLDTRRSAALALALAPPVAVGLALRGPIERSLGRPLPIAGGLAAGALAMALADARAPAGGRRCAHAGPADGLALGAAQALALAPGVSRCGATLTAARLRGFAREDSHALSWLAAMPLILGAGGLELVRAARGRRGAGAGRAIAAGAAGAFASTLAADAVLRRLRLRGRPLWPLALYRGALAGAVVRRALGGRA